MTFILFGTAIGVPVATIEVNSREDIQLLDDRFELHEVKEVEVEDEIHFTTE